QFGRYREAVEAFHGALKLRTDAETYSLRGWAYLGQEAARPALADFDAALNLDSTHVEALRGRATALLLVGRTTDAEKLAEDILRRGPRTPVLLVQMANLFSFAFTRSATEDDAFRCRERALDCLEEALTRTAEDER